MMILYPKFIAVSFGVYRTDIIIIIRFICEAVFSVLQAILGRKLVSSEVFELMQKVCQLSVTSDSDYVRQQCRQVSQLVFIHSSIYLSI